MGDLVQLNGGGPRDNSQSSEFSLTRKEYLRIAMEFIIHAAGLNEDERKRLLATELLYGVGEDGVYGVCLYGRWFRDGLQDVIQVSALFGESPAEKWVTLCHELAHVLAGAQAAHGAAWKAAARRLGLLKPRASGLCHIEDLHPTLASLLQAIPLPTDGLPVCNEGSGGSAPRRPRGGCTVGMGTRGGTTRGPGSGRMRLWICECPKPVRVRVASDDLRALCLACNHVFRRAGTVPTAGSMELINVN